MSRFLIRRLVSSLPVLFGILLVTFVMARGVKGDACRAILGERATQESCDRFIIRNGLDKPIPVQFVIYISHFVTGDLGESFRFGKPVTEMLAERLPAWAAEIDCANWAQFLLKFIVSHPQLTCAIPATSQVAHVRENMGAARGRLPDAGIRTRMASLVAAM